MPHRPAGKCVISSSRVASAASTSGSRIPLYQGLRQPQAGKPRRHDAIRHSGAAHQASTAPRREPHSPCSQRASMRPDRRHSCLYSTPGIPVTVASSWQRATFSQSTLGLLSHAAPLLQGSPAAHRPAQRSGSDCRCRVARYPAAECACRFIAPRSPSVGAVLPNTRASPTQRTLEPDQCLSFCVNTAVSSSTEQSVKT